MPYAEIPSTVLLSRGPAGANPRYVLAEQPTNDPVLGIVKHFHRVRREGGSIVIVAPDGRDVRDVEAAEKVGAIHLVDGFDYNVIRVLFTQSAQNEVWRCLMPQLAFNDALTWRLRSDESGLSLVDESGSQRAVVSDTGWWLVVDPIRCRALATELLTGAGLAAWPDSLEAS